MSCTQACVRPWRLQAHCGAEGCHLTFGSVWSFDRHRRGGRCLSPAELEFRADDRGVFRALISDADRARLTARGVRAYSDAPSGRRT